MFANAGGRRFATYYFFGRVGEYGFEVGVTGLHTTRAHTGAPMITHCIDGAVAAFTIFVKRIDGQTEAAEHGATEGRGS